MKFIASSSSLLKHLQQVSGVIGANTVLPILEDFLFEISEKKLIIVAADLETVMSVQMDIENKENGKVCIPAKMLIEYLKTIPDQPLSFDIDSNFVVKITSDNGTSKIMGESADSFPKEPKPDTTTTVTMPSNALLTAINKTLFSVSNDDLRPAMTGIYFELNKEGGIRFVATDAHRLMLYRRLDVICSQNDNFIVPKKPLNILKNTLPDSDEILTINYNSNHLFVKHGSTQLICRLIDARFPDYKVVIPTDNPYKLVVNKIDFQNALRRVNVFSNKSTNQVALTINGSSLQMASQDIDFSVEGNERMNCEFDGGDLQIAFNAKFLIEMLNAADSNDIKIELSTSSKAGIVKPTEQHASEELLMLVMPLMLNSNA